MLVGGAVVLWGARALDVTIKQRNIFGAAAAGGFIASGLVLIIALLRDIFTNSMTF
jgi:hypothetical protein